MLLIAKHRRGGVTLVELLVVITILGLLAVTVIPNISNTGGRRKVREAARAVASFIAAGQSRAIGSKGGAGVWIAPLPNTVVSGSLNIGMAIDLANADIARPYCGDSPDSMFTCTPSVSLTMTGAFINGFTPAMVRPNSLIRFQGSPTWFQLSVTGSTGQVAMRATANQRPENTRWPNAPNGIAYEIVGPPTASTGNTLTLGDGVAIDLYHSTMGNNLQAVVGSGTSPFQIINDATGRPAYLSCGGNRLVINDTLFLLVASIESIQDNPAPSLAAKDGFWVGIDPRGGVPKVTEVDPTGQTLTAQQSFIRQGSAAIGR